jgi:hypothetical protein
MNDREDERKSVRYHVDRFDPEYRHAFESITQEMQQTCPIAWSETHGGHWVAAGNREVIELARSHGAGLDETNETWQRLSDEQGLAEPITARH